MAVTWCAPEIYFHRRETKKKREEEPARWWWCSAKQCTKAYWIDERKKWILRICSFSRLLLAVRRFFLFFFFSSCGDVRLSSHFILSRLVAFPLSSQVTLYFVPSPTVAKCEFRSLNDKVCGGCVLIHIISKLLRIENEQKKSRNVNKKMSTPCKPHRIRLLLLLLPSPILSAFLFLSLAICAFFCLSFYSMPRSHLHFAVTFNTITWNWQRQRTSTAFSFIDIVLCGCDWLLGVCIVYNTSWPILCGTVGLHWTLTSDGPLTPLSSTGSQWEPKWNDFQYFFQFFFSLHFSMILLCSIFASFIFGFTRQTPNIVEKKRRCQKFFLEMIAVCSADTWCASSSD